MQPDPFIFTFFSFKGGVGRTMAAVNTAYALAGRGRDVLLVDMDIEAPGLSTFLRQSGELEGRSSGDVLDLLMWAKGQVRARDGKAADEASAAAPAPNLSQFVARVPAERLPKPRLGDCGRLDVLAVHDDRDYVPRLRRLGPGSSAKSMVVGLSRALRQCLRQGRVSVDVPEYYGDDVPREKSYDYILVDSRTGLTEIGGLCVGPLADRLVVLVALNDQNVTWTGRFLKTIGVTKPREEGDQPFDAADPLPSAPEAPPRLGPKPTLLVASPVPFGETDLTRERLTIVEETLGTRVAAKLSYHPLIAVKETVFVRDYPDVYLAGEYRALADRVMASVNDHAAQLAALSHVCWENGKDRVAAVDAVVRLASHDPDLGWGLMGQLHDGLQPTTDAEFIAADRMSRILASVPSARQSALLACGVRTVGWGNGTAGGQLRGLRLAEAVRCCSSVVEMQVASAEGRALALVSRGVAYRQLGRLDAALADFAAVLAMPEASAEPKAAALVNRGGVYGQTGKPELELVDYAAVLAMPDAPVGDWASALVGRGIARSRAGESGLAVADFATVVGRPDVPSEQKARALINHGIICQGKDNPRDAWPFFTAALDLAGIPAREKAQALTNRGNAYRDMHQVDLALADYGAVLAMPEAPAEQKAKALVNRGVVYGRTGKPELELADYGAVLAMPEAPAEQKAGALVNRGVVYGRTGKPELALADYGAVLAMPEAPAEQKAGALGNLGWLHYQAGRFAEFAAASRDSLTLDPSSTTNRANLGLALLHLAKPEEARAEYTTVLAQITSADELEEKVLTDLREALSREPDLQGARLVLNLAEERRRALAAPTPSS